MAGAMLVGRSLAGGYSPAIIVDILERSLAAALFVQLCYRFFTASLESFSIVFVLIAVSELFVVVFLVFRKLATDLSPRYRDWVVAALGTCLPLLVVPMQPSPLVAPLVCISIMLFGLCLQIASKGFLNRSFGIVPANRGIKTRGPYAFVRHPIYLGYALTHVGFLLFAPSAWNLGLYATAFAFQVSRMYREERVLSGDPAYRTYAAAVPNRLIPGIF